MPNSLQSSAIVSPASRRATNCSLSSITEHSFQGIFSSPTQEGKCYPCVRYNVLPMSQAAHQRSYLRKLLTVTSYCCQLSIFLLHSNMNLSRSLEENGYGALHSHRAHQRWQREISLRQCAVLEKSSSYCHRRCNLLPPTDQWRQAHSD